jgi:hypothetical protein
VTVKGITQIAFDRVTPAVRHKRDIDESEDGCHNAMIFNFYSGVGCRLEVRAESSCLDPEGLLRITNVTFEADSQCPNFPDANEGTYYGSPEALHGSAIRMAAPRVPDRNVASSCVTNRYEFLFAGKVTTSSTSTTGVELGPSTLAVEGTFVSNEATGACPVACPPCGATAACPLGQFCALDQCRSMSTYGACETTAHCPLSQACRAVISSIRHCTPNCNMTTPCPSPDSGTAAAVCTSTTTATGYCNLNCLPAGTVCPTGMACYLSGGAGLCGWPVAASGASMP